MNILLVGYGKMGKEIEKILLERRHQILGKVTSKKSLQQIDFNNIDVAIDFSIPDVVSSNLQFLLKHQIPVIVGTTGWYSSLHEVENWVKNNGGAMVYASNFSIGVQLFFQLNKILAKMMSSYPDYLPKIEETHHIEKLDKPSGTAITLANDLIAHYENLENWTIEKNKKSSLSSKNQLSIKSNRELDVKGIHQVDYQSEIDTISIRHEAHSRKGFALGAVVAAEWIQHKKGIFTMKDVLQLS